MRVAACADLHARVGDEARIRALFQDVRDRADALVIAGDLTDHGRPEEAEALARALDGVGVPVMAVLGNHDHEAGVPDALLDMLASVGVHCLERGARAFGDVGVAGAKGFGGGFGARSVRSFGEAALKAFVAESHREAQALRTQLDGLPPGRRLAVTHYAPVRETVEGEPAEIHVFLGSSRLTEAIDGGGAVAAVHGHAHHGSPEGRTPRGARVLNVSLPVLRATGAKDAYVVLDL
ncbi:MAG TPA: metallophosphoesterase [Candidatus Thermoplasmatota archaeon]|nr:metallophosphoesterase [Candidatus Thermoplasmatota archaeon]